MSVNQKMADFEMLVDELIKPQPNENRVKDLMLSLDLTYERDSVQRISKVLEKMNSLIFESKKRKVENDLQKHP